MTIKPRVYAGLLCLLLLVLALVTVAAQDVASLLTLTSPDPAYPAQFELLGPGQTPTTAGFSPTLDIGPAVDPALNRVYTAIENTGWSEGVVGLFSAALDPEGQYVALEVDLEGAPIEGGLAFELVYDEDLGDAGGFSLHVLISRTRRFVIYPAGVEDEPLFTAQTNVREEDGTVSQVPVDLSLGPEPLSPFDPLILEFHIVARAIPTATPEPAGGAAPASGGWGACGSCDACGHPGECMLSPDGQCFWNPGGCAASADQPDSAATAPPPVQVPPTNTWAPGPATNTCSPSECSPF